MTVFKYKILVLRQVFNFSAQYGTPTVSHTRLKDLMQFFDCRKLKIDLSWWQVLFQYVSRQQSTILTTRMKSFASRPRAKLTITLDFIFVYRVQTYENRNFVPIPDFHPPFFHTHLLHSGSDLRKVSKYYKGQNGKNLYYFDSF